MTIEIRAAEPSDSAAVLALWLEAETHPTTTDDPESVHQLLAHDPGSLLVAESDGTLVGSIIAGWDGWRGSIYRLAVSPSARRRGVAGALVREAERRLQALGARRLQAIVLSDDPRAIAFWRSSGWEEQDHRKRFVQSDVPGG
jgi:ribosomal protein S18 acetylase RimI-like enzyme